MTTRGLELSDVSKRFRDGARGEVYAVRGVSLRAAPGECVALTGTSGAGKSTVIGIAAGLLLPTSGEVRLDGESFSRMRESFRAHVRRRRMGVLVQSLALVPRMAVIENVLLGAVPDGALDRARIAGAEQLLERLGVGALGHAKVDALSGGERQRVALARALTGDPELLLLDEPTAHLDAKHVEIVAEQLRERVARDRIVLFATHDPRLLDALPAARRLDMRDGGIQD